jgi:release factor glutamine methyltransferase
MAEDLDGTAPWRSFLVETEERLTASPDVENAHREARWMLEEITGAERGEFAAALEQLATTRGVAKLDSMVERRLAGEPIQYVLGHWAFRRLDLMVDSRVLIPRPETEVVVDHALNELDRLRPDGGGVVVDLGTGSGAIGLAIAVERPGVRSVLTDISEDALAVARANLAGVGMAGANVEVHGGSWFDALPAELSGHVDVIVSNPPYVATNEELPSSVRDWEPATALLAGPGGRDDLDVLVSGAELWLRPGGTLILEMSPTQTADVAQLARDRDFEVAIHQDLAGRERLIVARCRE